MEPEDNAVDVSIACDKRERLLAVQLEALLDHLDVMRLAERIELSSGGCLRAGKMEYWRWCGRGGRRCHDCLSAWPVYAREHKESASHQHCGSQYRCHEREKAP